MSYKIKEYTKRQARKIGVIVRPSTRKGKKIDVYNMQGDYLASVGATGYADYPTYMQLERQGKVSEGTANARRKAYKSRHQKTRTKKWSRSWLADKLLW